MIKKKDRKRRAWESKPEVHVSGFPPLGGLTMASQCPPDPRRQGGRECEGHASHHMDQFLFATYAVMKNFIQNMYRLLQFNKKKTNTHVAP